LKQRLAEIDAKPDGESKDNQPPKLADFESYDDYVAALAEHKALLAFSRQQAQASSKAQEVVEQRRQSAIAQEWQAKVAEAREQLPDFDAVAFREDVVISDAVRDALLDSDMGARLAYHLGKNPDIAVRLSMLPPVSVAREIGRMEVQLSSQPAVSPTKAPEPPSPVKGSQKAEKDPDKMTEAEWFAWREKQLRSRK
jgi:thioester reductase-like protein